MEGTDAPSMEHLSAMFLEGGWWLCEQDAITLLNKHKPYRDELPGIFSFQDFRGVLNQGQ